MPELTKEAIERYLTGVFRDRVTVLGMAPLGEVIQSDSIKTYGYGKPIQICYELAHGKRAMAVFHTSSPSPFGHEHMSDRAQMLLWAHKTFNLLPLHARSLDIGAFQADGNLVSLGDPEEFCLLTEYVDGTGYNRDLQRLRDTGCSSQFDIDRADALCDYLLQIHRVRNGDRNLYTRRIRELVGHGECMMGLADSYPPDCVIDSAVLKEIEHLSVEWRWKLKPLAHRLRQIHGDFHPWNILFGEAAEFRVLDRSRGEFGDPADDVACITSNFLFFSLQRYGRLQGPLQVLFERFWDRYLGGSGDLEMLRVVPPFFAFRGLVMASPIWYPGLPDAVRQKLLNFIIAVLKLEEFDPREVNHYCSIGIRSFRSLGNGSSSVG